MQKNKKNGFLFFDLLIALMIVMTFVTLAFSTLSFLTSCYTTHKEYLFASDIINEILYRIDIAEQLPSKSVKKLGPIDFVITVDREVGMHTPIGVVNQMSFLVLTVSWINYRNGVESITLKTLNKGEIFQQ